MSAATTTDVSDASVVGVKAPAPLKAVVSYGVAALLAAVLTMTCSGTTTFSLSTSKDCIIIPAGTVPASLGRAIVVCNSRPCPPSCCACPASTRPTACLWSGYASRYRP